MNYIFGYGSIINDISRLNTLSQNSSAPSGVHIPVGHGGSCDGDQAVAAYLINSSYTRCWCFRSSTGFTALGLNPKELGGVNCEESKSRRICGVLFPVYSSLSLLALDKRESGYRRVSIPYDQIEINTNAGSCAARGRAMELKDILHGNEPKNAVLSDSNNNLITDIQIWAYIPDESHMKCPDEEFPILQTYVDVCIRGCLQWGGEELALEFLRTTQGWCEYYLNDAPMSRRPWLNRSDYQKIDFCLESLSRHVFYAHRKHPEEFAARHLTALRGLWGAPPRNLQFMGRESAISSLHWKLTKSLSDDEATLPVSSSADGYRASYDSYYKASIDSLSSINQVEVVGIGGVGKTQLVLEYVHRHFGSTYGLVAWLRAESPASIAADMRRLAFDLGILKRPSVATAGEEVYSDISVDDETVVEEVRRRLARCQCHWLLVFDNVEDPSIVQSYLPRGVSGSRGTGHVISTSRMSLNSSQLWKFIPTIAIDCFDRDESVRFLQSCLSEDSGDMLGTEDAADTSHLLQLADSVGHLPLALAMAAAYMNRCSVTPEEYCKRTSASRWGNPGDSILSTLCITLERIERESEAAAHALPCLGFLSSDNISKKLLKSILVTSHFKYRGPCDRCCSEAFRKADVRAPILSYMFRVFEMYSPLVYSAGPGLLFIVVAFVGCFSYCYVLFTLVSTAGIFLCTKGILCALRGAQMKCNLVLGKDECGHRHSDSSAVDDKPYSLPGLFSNIMNHNMSLDTGPAKQRPAQAEEQWDGTTDLVWDLLRQFSILSVRGPRSHRVGSIHRLQLSVIRARATDDVLHLERCIWVLSSLWIFDFNKSSSWDSCTELLEHIESLARYAIPALTQFTVTGEHNSTSPIRWCYAMKLTKLLNDAGSFSALVLSRFHTAQSFLDTAARAHVKIAELISTGIYAGYISSSDHSDLARDKATTLHNLGKVLRYNGRLEEAGVTLVSALAMRKQLAPESFEVAANLHELGVLFLKGHVLSMAKEFLLQSLTLKRLLNNISGSLEDRYNLEPLQLHETGEAATLHQLAIVATASRDYDEAERLLYEALDLELAQSGAGNETGSQLTSRAATLQQLGRVYVRRGRLVAAEGRFREALALYERVYGERRAACNVNVAAVRHQLGCTTAAAHRYDEACGHFTAALNAREALNNGDFEGQLHVVYELQSLAKAEMDRGNLSIAKSLFLREKLLVESLEKSLGLNPTRRKSRADSDLEFTVFSEVAPSVTISPPLTPKNNDKFNFSFQWLSHVDAKVLEITESQRLLAVDSISSLQSDKRRRKEVLCSCLRFALSSLRQLAKQMNDDDDMNKITRQLQMLRHRLNSCSDFGKQISDSRPHCGPGPAFQRSVDLVCALRSYVRQLCQTKILQSVDVIEVGDNLLPDSEDFYLIDSGLLAIVLNEIDSLEARLSEILYAENDHFTRDLIRRVVSVSKIFQNKVSSILYQHMDTNLVTSNFEDELYAACDSLRAELRALGAAVLR